MKNFLKLATDKEILKRAIKVAGVVGTLLAFINHFDSIVQGNLTGSQICKILITYTVPFGVSTYSQVMQRIGQQEEQ